MTRLLEITVCPREPGKVILPVERGGRPQRMDAHAIARHLERLIRRRGLAGRVWVREGCAGGCSRRGPNVNVDVFLKARPGEEQDHVAVDGRSYVYSLRSLPWLARIIDDNLRPAPPRGTS
ncbi:MAG: (2Fe-2S) ferredoxin domain-containing protein [Candidatus Rokubacteria bacterium]|nr:(2Fe-2S) ferredoxin domain-containing protein [Candidatus Rokubacteria bacterium]